MSSSTRPLRHSPAILTASRLATSSSDEYVGDERGAQWLDADRHRSRRQPVDIPGRGNSTGNYFAIQSDGGNGDELVVTPVSSSVAVSVFGNDEVQAGQILVAQASITGDATDQAASVTYQWEFSSNGGQTWSAPVASTTTGMVNGELSGLYQLTQAETGDLVRAVATFTDDTGQVQITTSTQTAAIAEISPILSVPFSYAVDDFSISKTLSGSTTNFNDNFSNGAPPIGGLFGTSVNAVATNGGGGGTTWTESSGHAIMSSSGAAFNGINNSVEATLLTNTSPEEPAAARAIRA